MGNKVTRFMRNYDAERRALKFLSRKEQEVEPSRAPRFEVEQQMLRRVADDPVLAEAINKKDNQLLQNLNKIRVTSSDPVATSTDKQKQSEQQHRPLPQRRHYIPIGELGVPEVPPESVPPGRLTLRQFQELLSTGKPQGITTEKMQVLLKYYAPLMQHTPSDFNQIVQQTKDNDLNVKDDLRSK